MEVMRMCIVLSRIPSAFIGYAELTFVNIVTIKAHCCVALTVPRDSSYCWHNKVDCERCRCTRLYTRVVR